MKNLLIIFISITLTSCATIFSPSSQQISIRTASTSTRVMVDTSYVGKGDILTHTLKKNKELVTVTLSQDSCKSERRITFQNSLSNWYYANFVPPFLFLSFMIAPFDAQPENTSCYDDVLKYDFSLKKYNYWNKSKKRIGVGDFTFNIKGSQNVWELYSYSDYEDNDTPSKTKNADSLIGQSDYFENHIESILKKTGYVDTTSSRIYIDNINNVYLQAEIIKSKIKDVYVRFGTLKTRYFLKQECEIAWSLVDIYGDTLFSAKVPGTSGEFAYSTSNTREMIDKSLSDAIESSFVDFFNLPIPSDIMSVQNNVNANKKITSIPLAVHAPIDLDQAMEAGVTIKDDSKQRHGSGFFISNNGYILTNYHVVANSEKLQVLLHSGKSYVCEIICFDKMSDLAIVKIEANVPYAYKLPIDKNYKTGTEIMVIGTPKSIELGQSVSKGIISGIRENPKNALTYIQTDASINGGNSGGAMINASGELIGVIDYKLINGTEGISFAIPAHTVQKLMGLKYE